VVVSSRLPIQQKTRMRQLLTAMHMDPKGKKILDELMIDRFVEPKEEWYDPIRRMKETLSLAEETPRANAKP